MIRAEVSAKIVGNLPVKRWDELAYGLWECAVEHAFMQGVRFGDRQYNQALFPKNMLADDCDYILQEGACYLMGQVMDQVPRTSLDYKFFYKIMPTGMNILVGIDERDFLIPQEDPPRWDEGLDY